MIQKQSAVSEALHPAAAADHPPAVLLQVLQDHQAPAAGRLLHRPLFPEVHRVAAGPPPAAQAQIAARRLRAHQNDLRHPAPAGRAQAPLAAAAPLLRAAGRLPALQAPGLVPAQAVFHRAALAGRQVVLNHQAARRLPAAGALRHPALLYRAPLAARRLRALLIYRHLPPAVLPAAGRRHPLQALRDRRLPVVRHAGRAQAPALRAPADHQAAPAGLRAQVPGRRAPLPRARRIPLLIKILLPEIPAHYRPMTTISHISLV